MDKKKFGKPVFFEILMRNFHIRRMHILADFLKQGKLPFSKLPGFQSPVLLNKKEFKINDLQSIGEFLSQTPKQP